MLRPMRLLLCASAAALILGAAPGGDFAFVAPAHAQADVVFTASIAPPPLPVYSQPPIPGVDTSGSPATGRGTARNTTGCPATGRCRRPPICCGRPATGPGTIRTTITSLMPATGLRRSAITAASTTASAIPASRLSWRLLARPPFLLQPGRQQSRQRADRHRLQRAGSSPRHGDPRQLQRRPRRDDRQADPGAARGGARGITWLRRPSRSSIRRKRAGLLR